ncbi:MAG: hypothetical protein ACRBB0_14595 [Pelagimonas sp.]|uniref:hypothetical protein n=1 Tax=Pelagimonas sp. TaxID=2073170 RepID=UPI003D6BFAF9
MNKPLGVLVLSALVLTSCGSIGGSRLNPFNWFGNSSSEPIAASEDVNPLIPKRRASVFFKEKDTSYRGTEIGEVTELLVERRPGGAIIRATAVADRQDFFDVKLIPVIEETNDSTLTFAFKALQSRGDIGTSASRTVTAAMWVTDNQLAGIREIRVKGDRNVRTTRR